MRKFAILPAVLILSSCSRESFKQEPENKVLLRLGPVYLTRSELETKIVELGPDYLNYLRTEQGKKALMEVIVKQKLLARAALDRGLERDFMVQRELRRLKREQEDAFRMFREGMLADTLLERLRTHELRVSDEEAAGYLKEHPRLIKVRQILVADRRKAEEILGQLSRERGNMLAEFGRLAKRHSLEAESAKRAGKIPAFLEGELDEAFERAAKALKGGQVSIPIETRLGVHLIFAEGSDRAPLSDEIKRRCRAILERKKLEALLELWKKRYVMEVRDETLRPLLNL